MIRSAARFRTAVLLLSTVSWVAAAAPGPQSTAKPSAKPPAAAPAVIDQKGFQELLERYRGKPLLVNFWATWCEPCREEYPMVNELARQYASRGLAVVGISLDEDAEINLVRHFLERNKPVFPNYRKRHGNEEAFINSVQPKWSGAIPATFFYSRGGRQAAFFVGEHSRGEFEKAIRVILEENSASPGR